MGLSETEFWELSFKEFDLLRKRHEMHEYRQWERTASIMCTIFNVNRTKRQKALQVKDILKNPFQEPKKQTAQDIREFFRTLQGK